MWNMISIFGQKHFQIPEDNLGMVLRIDKGSRAVRCVFACSGGPFRSTVIFQTYPESSYFSLSHDVRYIRFRLKL